MKILLGIVALLIIFCVVVGISGCTSYNGIVSASQNVDSQWAQVQSAYQRRSDLIPNLVNTVKGSAEFEKSTLEAVIKARASATQVNVSANTAPTDPQQFKQFEAAQGELSRSLGRLLVTVEKYPDLRTTSGFATLQAQLEGTENRINVSRDNFNEAVQAYNTKVQTFPTVIVARMGGFLPRPYFQASSDAQAAPTVDFGATSPAPASQK
ncbi:MAG: LemA family protein [Tepidisphaeraceae bacterium]